MRLLLDSNVLLWWATGSANLPRWAADAIASEENEKLVSAASLWELEIKRAKGKLAGAADLSRRVIESGFGELRIGFREAAAAAALPRHHGDPFDRMLVAQARLAGLTIVTADAQIARYDVAVLPPT